MNDILRYDILKKLQNLYYFVKKKYNLTNWVGGIYICYTMNLSLSLLITHHN